LLKRLFFVAPVAAAALSLSAVTAFANASPPPAQADCVALSNQQASQKAKLDQDQDALNLAKQEVVNLQGVVDKDSPVDAVKMKHDKDAVAAAQNKVTNLQGIVQKDQGDLQQTQNQTTNQNVCNGSRPSGSGGGGAAPPPSTTSKPSDNQGNKDKKRGHAVYNCVAISNEKAAQSAKLEQDQDAVNAAKQKLASLQGAKGDAKVKADNEVKNLQKIVQADKANLSQNQTQNTTQNVCNTTTTNNYYTSKASGSGSGAGAGTPSDSGSGSGSGEPGLPQTGVA